MDGWGDYLKDVTYSWENANNRLFVLVQVDDENEPGKDQIAGAYPSADAAFLSYAQRLQDSGYFTREIPAGATISADDIPPIEYFPVDGPLFSIYLGGGGEEILCATREWRIEEYELGYENGRAVVLGVKKRSALSPNLRSVGSQSQSS
jgi:hypothetical protein